MSIQTYAMMFYGFPVEDDDVIDKKFKIWELEERICDMNLEQKVRSVSYGLFDNNLQALALYHPYFQADIDLINPLQSVSTQFYYDKMILISAAKRLGIVYKDPNWYLTPARW